MVVVVISHIGHMIVSMVMMTITSHYISSIEIGMVPTEVVTNMVVERVVISNYSIENSTASTDTHRNKHVSTLQNHIKKQFPMLIDSPRMNYIIPPIIMLDGMNHFIWHPPGLGYSK